MTAFRDRRFFKRYKHTADFYIIIGIKHYKASTIDFSLSGLCIFIEEITHIEVNSVIDIKIDAMDIDIQGRGVWTKKSGQNLIVGIEKMSISGLLNYYPLADILLDLQRSNTTGVLNISNGEIYKEIYIKDGVVVFAQSTQKEDQIEEILLRTGKISNDQYYQSVDFMKKTGKHQVKVLFELGYLKHDELLRAVKTQAEEIILSLFSWEDGVVKFLEGPLPERVTLLKLSAASLIFRGIQRIKKPDYFKSVCPPLDTILYYSTEPINLFQDINFSETDSYVLSLIDSKLTVKELLTVSSLGEAQTMKILYALLSTRMIEEIGKGVLPDTSVIKMINEPPKEANAEFVAKVENLYQQLDSIDYYSILGIDKRVTQDDIRRAYYKCAKEFHPDRHLSSSSDTMKGKLSAIFGFFTDAYKTLSDIAERGKYDKRLSIKPQTELKTKKSNKDRAKHKFQEGHSALMRGLYVDAIELLGQAVYLDPMVADYYFTLGTAYAKQKKFKEAENEIRKALKLDSENPAYIAELGHIYLGLGLKLRAKSSFEKVMKASPFNKRAQEGLAKVKEED